MAIPALRGGAPALGLAAAGFALLAAVYAVALGIGAATRADSDVRFHPLTDDWRLIERVDAAASPSTLPVLLVLGAAAVIWALAAGRPRAAIACAATIAAAGLGARALKWALGALDPLGGDAVRAAAAAFPVGTEGTFPSGHSAVATAVALGLMIAAPPGRQRVAAGAAGVPLVTAFAVMVLGLKWHYPSDVAGGILLALGCAAMAVALADPDRGVGAGPRRPSAGLLTAALGLAASAAIAAIAVALLAGRDPAAFLAGNAGFAASAAIVAAMTAASAAAIQAALRARAARGPAPQPRNARTAAATARGAA